MLETSNATTDVSDDDQDQGKPATKKLKIDDFSELCDRDCDDSKRNVLAEYVNIKVHAEEHQHDVVLARQQ